MKMLTSRERVQECFDRDVASLKDVRLQLKANSRRSDYEQGELENRLLLLENGINVWSRALSTTFAVEIREGINRTDTELSTAFDALKAAVAMDEDDEDRGAEIARCVSTIDGLKSRLGRLEAQLAEVEVSSYEPCRAINLRKEALRQ